MRRRWRTSVVFLAVTAAAAATAEIKTVTYRCPWGSDTVTFDSQLTSRKTADLWMRYSPFLSPYNNLAILIGINQCLPEDSEYVLCGASGGLNPHNIKVNIARIRKIRLSLDSPMAPVELTPVLNYFKKKQDLAIWIMERQQEYILTGQTAVLSRSYNEPGEAQDCALIRAQIEHERKERRREEMMITGWANCISQREASAIGSYPITIWKKFLETPHMTEINLDKAAEN